ncbi:hypothetical protein LK994_12340 [Ferruginibacter lapsinanis]|uniref:toxin-antitoxin system YwqK family antitoxin n=1 Tax=Ferruginibacter lapsinanis TaxID=563172 RepID=UPI001E3F6B2C|nr:hypothetical protein [Ferruginibacter lapsinanis]UEG49421.1 hypothetical protein LK994_12340 [Ferruginibacter lapsinanis]
MEVFNKRYLVIAIISMIFISCTSIQNKNITIKIAKTVAPIYIERTDSGFAIHNDTVYYQNKLFTGYRYSLFNNTDTEFVRSYFNGVEEGEQRVWYSNKQLAEYRFYINGKKEGTQKGWWPDGRSKFIYTAANDAFVGELKEWNAAGLLCKWFHYVNGQEEGSQKMWWDDGSIRANYVIRNGKKYGLLGIKLCSNPYDSIIKK